LRLGHEGSGFMQVLFDLGLQIRRCHSASQSRAMVDLPGMIHAMFRLMHHFDILRMWVASGINRTCLESPCGKNYCQTTYE
jgi:hypothetical protein